MKSAFKIFIFTALFLLLISVRTAWSQLLINEVQITNLSTISDEDGEYSDWLELYNAGSTPLQLNNYSLSDRIENPSQWVLPDMTLNPGQHTLIFASGKNRYPAVAGIDHFEVPVFPWNWWTYIVPQNQPPANWNEPGFNDSAWNGGNGGLGFADGDDGTELPTPSTSVFARTVFELDNASAVAAMILTVDYDDAFVCYLNGEEIARENIGTVGIDPAFNALADVGHEANGYQNLPVANFIIDPGVFGDLLVNGDNVLAFQVHNVDPFSSDMTGNFLLTIGMTDDDIQTNEAPEWLALDITEAHTNFGLSIGETLFVFDNAGALSDSLTMPAMQSDHVIRRSVDGGDTWCFSTVATPDDVNSGACLTQYEDKPHFSAESGVYPAGVFLILSSDNPDAEIRYTTDGSVPDENSTLYDLPIIVSASAVISARAFSSSALPSMVEKNTYMIEEYALGLPVVSVSTDPANLWDPITGIHVFGPEDYDPWYPHFGANFWEDWERLAYVEYFDSNHVKQMEGPVGVKIHGGWSRGNVQKSLRIQAKGKYGMEEMNYPLIPDKPYITSFKGFNLRNGGNAYGDYRFHEALIERTTRETNVDYMSYAPAIVFLNGEYWGFMEIRENLDQHYIADNHDVGASDVTVVSANYLGFNVINGNPDSFYALHEYATQNDPSGEQYIQEIGEMLDLENYADYIIAQTYWANGDWSNGWQNNTKLWHDDRPGGKWRFMLMDMDFGMGLAGASPNDNYIQTAGDEGYLTDQLFGAVIQNETFRNYFINRYADLINTEFQSERVTALGNEMKAEVEPIFQRHAERWGTWAQALTDGLPGRLNWAAERVQGARNVVQDHFDLPGQVTITLDVQPAGAGRIEISTISPNSDSYPWSGVYFMGVPVRITAFENPGYSFSHWLANDVFDNNNPQRTVELFFENDLSFTAVFEGQTEVHPLSVTELMFNPDDQNLGGDWLEIHNNLDVPLNLSGWIVRDNNYFNQFEFPEGFFIDGGEYLILPQDHDLFSVEYPEVISVAPSLGFGFSNFQDKIEILSPDDSVFISFEYSDDEGEWLKCSDGCGHTRGHNYDEFNYQTPYWFLECERGSPGAPYATCNYDIIINEINYNSAPTDDAGDWFEIANRSDEPIDLSGWSVRDGGDGYYEFAQGQTIPVDGYLVIARDLMLFTDVHSAMTNLLGPAAIALGNNGDMIRIYNDDNDLVFSMEYDQYAPWPFEANGMGKTLEFSGEDLGFCNPLVWFAGCENGSPGVAYYENCFVSAVNNISDEHLFNVYPNPAYERIFIQHGEAGKCDWEILDMTGRRLMHGKTDGLVTSIELEMLSSGFYQLRLLAPSGKTDSRSFMKN